MIGGPRGVLGGLILLAVGVAFLLPPLGVANAGSYLFVALGVAFALAYLLGSRQYVYLVPAGTLLGFGLGLLLPTWLALPAQATAPVFLAAIALGLAAVYLLAPANRWPLLPAAVLGLLAIADLLDRRDLVPAAAQPFIVPFVLILVGAYLLVEPRTR